MSENEGSEDETRHERSEELNTDEIYEGAPPSLETKIPRWLILSYAILPFVGFLIFYLYWDGSEGWLDRGYWRELQEAAKTTGPYLEP